MHRLNCHRAVALAMISFLPFAGCGTGDYQERMKKTAQNLEFSGNFESNLHSDFADVNPDCKLRLPSIFDSNSTGVPNGASPAVCNIPGLNMTYQKFMDEGEKSYPFYCYFAASPIRENQKPEEFKAELEASVAKGGATGGKFTTVSVSSPTGATQNWELLSITSQQNFPGKNPGQDATIEGRFDLYFRSTGKDFVLVGWRAPKAAAASGAFFENAKLAMGTAQVTETAPATTPPAGGS